MDQKIRSGGAYLSSIILSGCSVMAFILGLSFVFSYPEEMWWIGLLLLLCCLLAGYSAVSIYRKAKKEKKLSDHEINVVTQQKAAAGKNNNHLSTNVSLSASQTELQNAVRPRVQILASWLYTGAEWKEFMKWERRKSKSNTFYEAAILFVFITPGIHYLRDIDWKTSALSSLAFVLLYGIIKYLVGLSSIKLEENKLPEVVVTNDSIIVNGHMNRFYGDNLWLGKVDINDAGEFNVLEITYCWETRGGKTSEEIRVPVPKGCLKEAILVQEQLMNERKLIEQVS